MRVVLSLVFSLIAVIACIPMMLRVINWTRKRRRNTVIYWSLPVGLALFLVVAKIIHGGSLILPLLELAFFSYAMYASVVTFRPGRHKDMGPVFPNVGQEYMRKHGNLRDDNYQFQRAKVKALSDMKESLDALYYAERITNGSSTRQAA